MFCRPVENRWGEEKGVLERGLPGRSGRIWVGIDEESISGGRKALNKGGEADKSLFRTARRLMVRFVLGEYIEAQGQGSGLGD